MSGRYIAQLAKMSIDPKFVELTADVFRIILLYTPEYEKNTLQL